LIALIFPKIAWRVTKTLKVTLLVTIFGSILVVLAFVFVVYRISVNQKTVDPGVQMTSTAPPDNSVPDHAITGIAVDPFCGD